MLHKELLLIFTRPQALVLSRTFDRPIVEGTVLFAMANISRDSESSLSKTESYYSSVCESQFDFDASS
jgi:hypothetical protein